jgi:hypothetical protein
MAPACAASLGMRPRLHAPCGGATSSRAEVACAAVLGFGQWGSLARTLTSSPNRGELGWSNDLEAHYDAGEVPIGKGAFGEARDADNNDVACCFAFLQEAL